MVNIGSLTTFCTRTHWIRFLRKLVIQSIKDGLTSRRIIDESMGLNSVERGREVQKTTWARSISLHLYTYKVGDSNKVQRLELTSWAGRRTDEGQPAL